MHATATSGCSQEDYPAVVLTLSSEVLDAPPVAHIEIVGAPPPPFEIALSPLRRDPTHLTEPFARAWKLRASGEPAWLSGTLRVQRLVPGEGVDGHLDFRAPDGGTGHVDFHAIWQASSGGCG
jgi:hypothetical protein